MPDKLDLDNPKMFIYDEGKWVDVNIDKVYNTVVHIMDEEGNVYDTADIPKPSRRSPNWWDNNTELVITNNRRYRRHGKRLRRLHYGK